MVGTFGSHGSCAFVFLIDTLLRTRLHFGQAAQINTQSISFLARQAPGLLMSQNWLNRAGETSREIRLVGPKMQEGSGKVVLSE